MSTITGTVWVTCMYLEHHLGYEDKAVTLDVLKSGYQCYSDGSRLARDDIWLDGKKRDVKL